MATITEQVVMNTEICITCGITFAVPSTWQSQRRSDHAKFWCPNGHQQCYVAKSDAEKFREQLFNKQAEINNRAHELEVERRAHEKTQKKLKSAQKRAAAGVCPCCNRTFKELSQHMQSKHKEFLSLQGVAPRKQLSEKVQ